MHSPIRWSWFAHTNLRVGPHASTLPGRDAPRNRLRWGRHPARCSTRVVPCICTPNCTCTPPLSPATAPTRCKKELQRCNRFQPPCTLPRGRIGPTVSILLPQHGNHATSNSANACGDQRRIRTPRSEAQKRGRVGCWHQRMAHARCLAHQRQRPPPRLYNLRRSLLDDQPPDETPAQRHAPAAANRPGARQRKPFSPPRRAAVRPGARGARIAASTPPARCGESACPAPKQTRPCAHCGRARTWILLIGGCSSEFEPVQVFSQL